MTLYSYPSSACLSIGFRVSYFDHVSFQSPLSRRVYSPNRDVRVADNGIWSRGGKDCQPSELLSACCIGSSQRSSRGSSLLR